MKTKVNGWKNKIMDWRVRAENCTHVYLASSEGGSCQVLMMLERRAARMIGCRTFAGEYAGRVTRRRGMVGDWRYGIRVVRT